MTYTCPQGHQSSTADFCDVCGDPIDATTPSALSPPGGAAPASAPAPPAPPASAPSSLNLPDPNAPAALQPAVTCPNCSTENPADALFCESCGYDFTTGQLPTPVPTSAPPPSAE